EPWHTDCSRTGCSSIDPFAVHTGSRPSHAQIEVFLPFAEACSSRGKSGQMHRSPRRGGNRHEGDFHSGSNRRFMMSSLKPLVWGIFVWGVIAVGVRADALTWPNSTPDNWAIYLAGASGTSSSNVINFNNYW